jgi:uncharacterized membrane protein/protein-disulfide isomerase
VLTAARRRLLLVFGAIGLAAASTSTYVHYKLLADPAYTSFCDVNSTVSCTEAYLSPYGSLWGIPVALAGVLFFAVVLLLVWAGSRDRSPARDNAASYIFVWSTVGLAMVFYLAWASYVQLRTFCLLCAVTYVAVIAIFIISSAASKAPLASLPGRAAGDLGALVKSPLALGVVVLLAIGMVAGIQAFPDERGAAAAAPASYPPLTAQQRTELEQWWDVQPKVDLPIQPEAGRILIVKFSDYMCPACRQTFEWYKPILAKYASRIQYVVEDYPLEAECNSAAPGNHYASCEAAAAVKMARGKGTADRLEQWIFDNQPSLSPDTVKKAARDIGGIGDFDAQYSKTLEAVRAEAKLGAQLGIDQTPTFYIAGRKLPGPNLTPPQYFDYLIELALKDASAPPKQ